MIGAKIKIDGRAALINYYIIMKELDNRQNRKYCNTLKVISRRVKYKIYYNDDQLLEYNTVNYELIKKIFVQTFSSPFFKGNSSDPRRIFSKNGL